MKYIFFAGLLAITGVNAGKTSFIMHEGGEPIERLHRVPEGWNEIGAPAADHTMRFRIAVRSVRRAFASGKIGNIY
jgi:tripeptidyl-peptidase-1